MEDSAALTRMARFLRGLADGGFCSGAVKIKGGIEIEKQKFSVKRVALAVLAIVATVTIILGGCWLVKWSLNFRFSMSPTQYSREESWSLILPSVSMYAEPGIELENVNDDIRNWYSAIAFLREWYTDVYSNPGTDIGYESSQEGEIIVFHVRGVGVRKDGRKDNIEKTIRIRLPGNGRWYTL